MTKNDKAKDSAMTSGLLGKARSLRALLLLLTLLAVTVLSLVPLEFGQTLLPRLVILVTFCFGGSLLASSRHWLLAYLSLAAPTLILGLFSAFGSVGSGVILISSLFSAALGLLLFQAILSYSLFSPKASRPDRIVAGLCGYLLIALFWSNLYFALCSADPAALISSQSGPVGPDAQTLTYFSIVTLTTLGYGDIVPGDSSWARLLCAFEALVGTLYLAVFISSLISSKDPVDEN